MQSAVSHDDCNGLLGTLARQGVGSRHPSRYSRAKGSVCSTMGACSHQARLEAQNGAIYFLCISLKMDLYLPTVGRIKCLAAGQLGKDLNVVKTHSITENKHFIQ